LVLLPVRRSMLMPASRLKWPLRYKVKELALKDISSVDIRPGFLDLVVTEDCMLRCKMCKMWEGKNVFPHIPTQIWEDFIDSFARLTGGDAQIQFVGGEPLLKPGILDLISHAASKGFRTTMTTNGYLIDQQMAEKIVNSGLQTIVFSLDGAISETHDFLRGKPGVHERVMRALANFSAIGHDGLSVRIVTTIMQPNLKELVRIAQWAQENSVIQGISFQAVMQPFATPDNAQWYRQEESSFLWPNDRAEVDAELDKLIAFKQAGYKITNPEGQFGVFKAYFRQPEQFVKVTQCNLGYNSLSVNTHGDIYLCFALPPLGNIRDKPEMSALWVSAAAREVRQQIKKCNRNCKLMINCFFEEEKKS
jgi:MoaA/NifB/PqqE/SkfB family radical SAM enzyme